MGGFFSAIGHGLGKIFGKGGIDPTMATLGGLQALLGGGDSGPKHYSFRDASPAASELVNPIQSLFNSINSLNNFGVSTNNAMRNGSTFRSSYIQPGPAPVRIPGLNLQIGGGLATDPALKDPSLLTIQTDGDYFSPLLSGGTNMSNGYSAVPRRRSPQ